MNRSNNTGRTAGDAMPALSKQKVSGRYIAILAFAVASTWILHELAHWFAGTLLQYEMAMTLNSSYPLSGQYASEGDYLLVSAAGPCFTLAEALLIFLLMRQRHRLQLYPFLFVCFIMRLLATIISLKNPNDEARISKALGIGTYTLPVLVCILLLAMLCSISAKYRLRLRFNLINLGFTILVASLIILGDMYLKLRLIG